MTPNRWSRRIATALACACGWMAGCYPAPEYDLEKLGVPKFVATNYIDLAGLTRISLFRSHDGHDYSDDFESCRSMKHYFKFPTSEVRIHAPVTGVVGTVSNEWAGATIRLVSVDRPAFTFIIFHVSLAAPLPVGTRIPEGTLLGTHVGTQTNSDIAVEVNTPKGIRLVSYFETLTDGAFAPFQARGIESPASLIITRAERDASPLRCEGETITGGSGDPYPPDVAF